MSNGVSHIELPKKNPTKLEEEDGITVDKTMEKYGQRKQCNIPVKFTNAFLQIYNNDQMIPIYFKSNDLYMINLYVIAI